MRTRLMEKGWESDSKCLYDLQGERLREQLDVWGKGLEKEMTTC